MQIFKLSGSSISCEPTTGHNFPDIACVPFLHLYPFNCGQCTLLKPKSINHLRTATSRNLWKKNHEERNQWLYLPCLFTNILSPTFLYLYHNVLCLGDGCCKRSHILLSLSTLHFPFLNLTYRWMLPANQVATSLSTLPVSLVMLE